MEFSLDRFYQLNRKVIIWIVLFGLIYLVRDFFTLIFLTFIICFFTYPASQYLRDKLKLNQSLAVIFIYLLLFAGYIAIYILVIPSVVAQARIIAKRLPDIQADLKKTREVLAERYPDFVNLVDFGLEDSRLTLEEIDQKEWGNLIQIPFNSDPLSPIIRKKLSPELLQDLNAYNTWIKENNATNSISLEPLTNTNAPSPQLIQITNPDANEQEEVVSGDVPDEATQETPPFLINDENESAQPNRLEILKGIIDELNQEVIQSTNFFHQVKAEGLKNPPPELELLLSESALSTQSLWEIRKINRRILETSYEFIPEREYKTEDEINKWLEEARSNLQKYLPNIAVYIWKFFWNSIMAILFSFLIVYDYARLSRSVKGLASSKLRDFFIEASQPVVKFAVAVGMGFQAIIIIAFITMVMVVISLLLLNIPSVAFLAVVTFLTSLVPVVGIFFEVIPVLLVAFNAHGLDRTLWVLFALGIIHFIIGYVITPIIFGKQFKINLVAIIFILFIGNQLAGLWGVILGVPVANYIIRDVLSVPIGEDDPSETTDSTDPGSDKSKEE